MLKRRHLNCILIIALVFLASCARKPEPVPIPSNALLSIEIKNLDANWEQLKNRKFSQNCIAWRLWQKPWFQEVRQQFESVKFDFKRNTGLPLNETVFMMVFGKQINIALLPEKPIPSIVFVADLGMKSTPLKRINKGLESLEKERLSTFSYLDHDVTVVNTQKSNDVVGHIQNEIFYCFDHNRVIATSSRTAMKSVIDILEGQSSSLSSTEEYRSMVDHLGKSDMNMFGRPGEMVKQIQDFSRHYGIQSQTTPETIHSFVANLSQNDKGFEIETILQPAQNQDDLSDKLYPSPDATMTAAHYLPVNSIAAFASGINLPELINHQKNMLDHIDSPNGTSVWNTLTASIQKLSGLDIPEGLVNWGGNGAFLNIENIRMITVFPVPELVFGFHVHDKDKAILFTEDVRRNLEKRFGKLVFMELPGSHTYSYSPVPFVAGLQPGYLMHEDYLVFGTTATAVASALSAADGRETRLIDDPEYSGFFEFNDSQPAVCKTFKPPLFADDALDVLDALRFLIISNDMDPMVIREILNSLTDLPHAMFRLEFEEDYISGKAKIGIN